MFFFPIRLARSKKLGQALLFGAEYTSDFLYVKKKTDSYSAAQTILYHGVDLRQTEVYLYAVTRGQVYPAPLQEIQ